MNIKAFWESKSKKEQRLILLSALVLVIGLLYHILWRPLTNDIEQLKQSNQEKAELLAWMDSHKSDIIGHEQKKSTQSKSKRPIFEVVEKTFQSLDSSGESPRISKANDKQVNVQFNKVPFDKFILKLEQLQKSQGYTIKQFKAKRLDEPGYVSVNCTLASS